MDVKMASLELDMRAVAPSPSGGAAPVQTVAIAATLAALVSIYLFFLVPYLQAGSGIFDATGHAFGRDFANIWTAGRLGVDGQTHLIYDLRLYHVVQDTYFGVDYPLQPGPTRRRSCPSCCPSAPCPTSPPSRCGRC